MHEPHYDPVPITPQRSSTSPWMVIIIVLGGCAVLAVAVIAVMAAVMLPAVQLRNVSAAKASCLSNAKQVSMGLLMYVQDYDDRFPLASAWQAELYPYIKNNRVYVCPSRPELLSGYAYNSVLEKKSMADITQPAAAPAIFESSMGLPNFSDQLQSFTTPHNGTGALGNVDGHVRALTNAPKATLGISQKALKRDGQLAGGGQ